MTIREVTQNDLEQVLTLYSQLHDDENSTAKDAQQMWERILQYPDHHLIVAEKDEKLVASCTITIIPNLSRNIRPYAIIENVITHEGYRRQGLAKQCLEYAIDLAAKKDCYKITLTTRPANSSAHRLYENLGFRSDLRDAFILWRHQNESR